MKDIVRSLAGGTTYFEISNVALDHPEIRISFEWGKNFVEICTMASREVVDTYNCLSEGEQFLKEIGADEPCDSGDDPNLGRRNKLFAKTTIRWGDHELTVEEYPPGQI
jgi:hypothetical protein